VNNSRVRWTCPKNGTTSVCQTCGTIAPHKVEVLAWDAPTCETHNVVMVKAPEARP